MIDAAFTYRPLPGEVWFGPGILSRLPEALDRLGARRALVLSTPNQVGDARAVARLLGDRSAGVFDGARMHVPIEHVRAARRHAEAVGADCAVAFGGGSTIGLGKAIALESGLPIIAVPTTYAGSEMTPIYGITSDGRKTTGRDARVLPKVVLYDPELSRNLPLEMSVASGINAMAHAAEALYAADANPVISLVAEEGIRALAGGLPRLPGDPRDPQARALCLKGAWLCGTSLGHVGMSLHHKLCHTLGGSFDMPHAQTHAVVLPHALAYNAAAAPQAMSRIARAIDPGSAEDAPALVFDLARTLGIPTSLRELGMPREGLDQVLELAVASPYPNPRPLEREALRSLLQDAWEGRRPTP